MLLNELVEINEKGIVANSVNFGLMDDSEINLNLCEGFIFNYNAKKPELSTVGILDAVRRSYHSRNQPNIHLMIQDYGKGKSHFGVVIANFFKKPFDSLEVQGILRQVKVATSGKGEVIAEQLNFFKQNQRHNYLVICLSGDKGDNIKKQFLQVLVKSLEAEGIQNSLAQNTCSEPLRYLESLDEQGKAKAENYLQSIGNPDGNLNSIIRRLRENNPAVISTVKNLAREITGFTPDFSADVDIEAILENLLNNYCTGENACFQGILILLDELNYYLQSWAADQIGAGGTALQNITNICEKYKGKIALLSFAQFNPSKALGISANAIPSYEKIASRLAPKDGNTYDNPDSSLEFVLDNLIIQKENMPFWHKFYERWNNTLHASACKAFERIKTYKDKGWRLEEFYDCLSKGCFPLHPLTAYLLCKLDFTQDRTVIQFIKGYVKNFIQNESVEKAGKLNYIYPITLVDSFLENFSKESIYTYYKKALTLVAGADESDDELAVLKALFLFYANGDKLSKSDREEHQEILSSLTGLPQSQVQAALNILEKTRDIIYYRPETKLYRFFEGINPKGIEEEIQEKVKDEETSVNDVVVHCQSRIEEYLEELTISATKFVKDNKLVADDWKFERKIYTIDRFIKILNSNQALKDTKEKGILAYVLAEKQEDLQEFRQTVNDYLSKSPIKQYIAVGIPLEETGDLSHILLKIKALKEQETSQKRLFGAAYEQLLQRWEEQVKTQLVRLFKSCTYHSVGLEKVPPAEQSNPRRVISAILQELYLFVPPVHESEKMRSDHPTGKKIVAWTAKQVLLSSSVSQQTLPDSSYKTVIDQIFDKSWHLFKLTSDTYTVQEPTNEKIRAAWDKISQIADLEGQREKVIDLEKIWKVLNEPPYGYSEYNFTMLLAGWLAYHRKEVSLKGRETLSKRGSVVLKTQSLKDWGNTDILQNPTAFVNDWIVKGKSKLIRRQKVEMPSLPASPMDYNQARQYLEVVEAFLDSNEAELEADEHIKKRKQVSAGIEKINNWFQPFAEAEALLSRATLEELLQLYPKLRPWSLQQDVILVQPTQQQHNHTSSILQTVREKIAELVETQNQRAKLLATIEECRHYLREIQRNIDQITQFQGLPPHLLETLQDALRSANRRQTEISNQAEEQQKISEDRQIMQTIREYKSATKTSTIYLCEQAINDVEDTKKRLHYPSNYIIEINEIIKYIIDKIATYRQSLTTLQTRFYRVDNLKDINQLRTECAELDLVFKNSVDYPTYQELKEQIQLLVDDLERLRNLETQCQQSDDIASCYNALAMISHERQLLQDSSRFSAKLAEFENDLRQKIQNYTAELKELERNLEDVNTAKEAQRLREELLKKSSRYMNSDVEEQYTIISSELLLLIDLLQISELVNVNSLESCRSQLEKLRQWESTAQGLTTRLHERLNSICAELEQKQAEIIQQQQVTAKKWLKDLETESRNINQLLDDTEKFELATNLLELINTEKFQYIKLLSPQELESLEDIKSQCNEEQGKHKINQILVLFRQLTRLQRQIVYERLPQYLLDETEDENV
jgi:hypothetical protein